MLTTDCIDFLITRLIRLTFPFAWGHSGVVLLWAIPLILRNDSISLDVKFPPSSLVSVFGKPYTKKILNNLEIMFAEVNMWPPNLAS